MRNSQWDNIRIVSKSNKTFEVQLEYGHIYTSPVESHVWNEWHLYKICKTLKKAQNVKQTLLVQHETGVIIE